jgi:hypothetical protein
VLPKVNLTHATTTTPPLERRSEDLESNEASGGDIEIDLTGMPEPDQKENSDSDLDSSHSSVVITLGLSGKVQNELKLAKALHNLGVERESLICLGTNNDFEPNTVVITRLKGSESMRGHAANVADKMACVANERAAAAARALVPQAPVPAPVHAPPRPLSVSKAAIGGGCLGVGGLIVIASSLAAGPDYILPLGFGSAMVLVGGAIPAIVAAINCCRSNCG